MKNPKITEEAIAFMKTLRFMNGKDGKEKANVMDEETVLLYEIWYNILSTECTKLYSKRKVREIKKQLIISAKEEIETINSKRLIGYDNMLGIINQAEIKRIQEIEEKIKYIECLDENDIINEIISSLYISKEYMELLKKHKDELEQKKLSKLSYNGQKCVEGTTINDEVLKKIYNHIKGKGLNLITKKVETKENANEQYLNLKTTEINAEKIIISDIADIYSKKIDKIKLEIKQDLEQLSKKKYKKFIDTEYINLVRILAQLQEDYKQSTNGIKKITQKKKQMKLLELISTIKGTIEHQKQLEKYNKQLEGFKITQEMKQTYEKTETSKEINEQRKDIIETTGIIINNITDEIIDLHVKNLKKELSDKAQLINREETCTIEEEDIKEFAHNIGRSVKETINFLKNQNSIYACLYTRLFGTEILEKINSNNVEYVLGEINPKLLKKNEKIPYEVQRIYDCQKKPQQSKQYKLKIRNKD